jgi:hypothetical protein
MPDAVDVVIPFADGKLPVPATAPTTNPLSSVSEKTWALPATMPIAFPASFSCTLPVEAIADSDCALTGPLF